LAIKYAETVYGFSVAYWEFRDLAQLEGAIKRIYFSSRVWHWRRPGGDQRSRHVVGEVNRPSLGRQRQGRHVDAPGRVRDADHALLPHRPSRLRIYNSPV